MLYEIYVSYATRYTLRNEDLNIIHYIRYQNNNTYTYLLIRVVRFIIFIILFKTIITYMPFTIILNTQEAAVFFC
jgi:hypothetical protein